MTSAIDGKVTTAWGIDAGPGRRNQSRKAIFVGDKPVLFSAGMRLKIELSQNHGGWNSDDLQSHNLGRFRISVTPTTEVVADPLPAGIRHCIENIPRDQRTPAQVGAIFSYWRTLKPEFKEANARLEALWKQWPDWTPLLIFSRRTGSGPGEKRKPTRLFKRGDWLKPDHKVIFGTPAVLHPLPADGDDSRLSLARWLTDPLSPTAARVAVNRLWQHYFAIGLVETSEDFGVQSAKPQGLGIIIVVVHAGHLEADEGGGVGLIAGVEQTCGVVVIFGAEGLVTAALGVLAPESFPAPEESEFWLHNRFGYKAWGHCPHLR